MMPECRAHPVRRPPSCCSGASMWPCVARVQCWGIGTCKSEAWGAVWGCSNAWEACRLPPPPACRHFLPPPCRLRIPSPTACLPSLPDCLYHPGRAHLLSCRHLGEELLWEGLVPVPAPVQPEGAITYRLVVVGEGGVVVKWASQRHTLDLPDDLEDGAIGGWVR